MAAPAPTSDHATALPFHTHLVHSPPSSFSLSYIVCYNAIYHWQKFTYQLPTCYGMELGHFYNWYQKC